MLDVEMEIESAIRLLDNVTCVADIVRFWELFGRTPYVHPLVEDIAQ